MALGVLGARGLIIAPRADRALLHIYSHVGVKRRGEIDGPMVRGRSCGGDRVRIRARGYME